jgi:hypothetical protein
MCPACITTALFTAVSASSTGGLTALALKKLCCKSNRNHIKPKRTEENEMKIEAMERSKTNAKYTTLHKTVSRAEWLVARKDLLTREKKLSRLRDEISRDRRERPWAKVEKEYIFDAPEGKVTLADLFDGRGS